MSGVNPNLVALLAAIPPTLTATAAFVQAIHNGRVNTRQHAQNANEIAETKDLLITHAARMGTIGRRVGDSAPPIADPTELSHHPQRKAPAKRTGGV